MTGRNSESWTPEETEALQAWALPPISPNLADRVLGALPDENVRPVKRWSRRRQWSGLAAVAAILLAVLGFLNRPQGGTVRAEGRSEIRLAGRGIAVLEPGTELEWSKNLSGAVVVKQKTGKVFFRVEPGGPFRVEVGASRVEVTGTCFGVEVRDMKAMKSSIKGGVVGAALASAVLVTVYEGEVVAGNERGELTLLPGESAELHDERTPRRRRALSALAPAQGNARVYGQDTDDEVEPDGLSDNAAALPEDYDDLVVEAYRLRERLRTAKARTEKAEARAAKYATYDLPQSELNKMAEKCELRWDWVGVDPNNAPSLNDADIESIGVAPDEAEAMNAVLKEYNAEMFAALSKLYTSVTGDPNVGSMAVSSMVSEIADKTDRTERRQAFQRIAAERARYGTAEPPQDGQGAFEQVFRLLHNAGGGLEDRLSEAVGPDLARAYREVNDGFNSKSRSSYGCPQQ